jgi:hypothetical protein
MGGLPHINRWARSVLSLILLTANVGAPFSSSDLSRSLLASLPRNVAPSPVVRVRTLSPSATSHGFRAVVGLSMGGPDDAHRGPISPTFSALPPSPTVIRADRHGHPAGTPPHTPLRC